MRRNIGFLACALGFACAIFAGLLAAVNFVGTDEALYYELQMRAGILDYAGITGEDLRYLDGILAQCLEGDSKVLMESKEIAVSGRMQAPFNERELVHMEDCRRLFVLLRTVMGWTAALGAGFLACGVYLLRNRRRIRLAAWISPLAIVVPLGLFAAWAVLDFHSAFNFFHEVLFTNDLWLLNPRTDLLIRICPSSMFMSMGARIGLMSLAWALIVPALAAAFTVRKKERV